MDTAGLSACGQEASFTTERSDAARTSRDRRQRIEQVRALIAQDHYPDLPFALEVAIEGVLVDLALGKPSRFRMDTKQPTMRPPLLRWARRPDRGSGIDVPLPRERIQVGRDQTRIPACCASC